MDVTTEAEALDIKDGLFDSLLESPENAADVKEIVAVAAEVGIKSKENLSTLYERGSS